MRARIVLSLAVAAGAAVALVSASGAATTKAQTATRIDVSTRAAVVHYLRSIHVSAKGVVIQRGALNYAGARCPGKGWTCAGTKHTVVQIAKRGGQNRFVCRISKCVVVQIGGGSRGLHAASRASSALATPVNLALCVKTTGTTQSCTINQPNAAGTNKAVVWMVTPKLTGLTQSAVYSASITQGPVSPTGSSNDNLACVKQSVTIDGSTTKATSGSVTVTSDSHESIAIQQNSLTGNNSVQGAVQSGTGKTATYDCGSATSPLQQDETLTSTVTGRGSITQNQDTATSGSANVVVDIEQNQAGGFSGVSSGLNAAKFVQTSNMQAIANTPKGPVSQTQSSLVPNPPYSGVVGTINQDSTGISTASATQTETQCQDAVNAATTPSTCDTNNQDPPGYSLTQTQYGPEGIFTGPTHSRGRVPAVHKGYGTATQTSNPNDTFTISQTSTQNTDSSSGQTNTVQGDCHSAGNCVGTQSVTNNGGHTDNGNGGTGTVTFGTSCTSNCTTTGNFPSGNVLVSVGNGKVQSWDVATSPATLVRTLDTGKGAGVYTTGLAFDSNKNLYVTDFNGNDVTKFNSDGSLAGSFGSGYNADPESIVFDSSGNAFVGQADGLKQVLEFDSSGNPLAFFAPAIEDRGTDWIDLASDGQTLYYTSEGTTVQTFNVSTNTQGPTFATGLPGTGAYAIKLLPSGGALVADTQSIVQLDSGGQVVKQFGTDDPGWFSLALGSNGTFWAGNESNGDVKNFALSCSDNPCNTSSVSFNSGLTPPDTADGLAVAP